MRTITVSLAAAALLALTACGTTPEPDVPTAGFEATEPAAQPEATKPGKYEQTWATPYSSTTCGDYLTTLDDHQQWVLAADMLSGARKVDGGTDLPDDTEVDRFQQDMATACEGDATARTNEMGVTIYMLDPSYKP
ncbi:hypothetical protein ACFW6X_34715 [Streptomyces bacillaris]|uniref:hypothetical protein n=1 Tax=Streptomyces bacillaris TaxID=68179 RepID=UPI0036930C6F